MNKTELLQHRQELHDRLFHSDIYVLPKARRLSHLVLHQVKYVSRLHALIVEDDIRSTRSAIVKNVIDGTIICLSTANVCNTHIESMIHKRPQLTNIAYLVTMINAVGKLAKTVEDIDHVAHIKPLSDIVVDTSTLLVGYIHIWLSLSPDNTFENLVEACFNRLDQVEGYNIHASRLQSEMYSIQSTYISGKINKIPTAGALHLSHI